MFVSCSFASLRVRTDTTAFLAYSHDERQDLTKSVSPALLAVPRGCLSNTSAVLEASVGNLFLPPTPKSWLHRPLPPAGLENAVAPGGTTTPTVSGTVYQNLPTMPISGPMGSRPLNLEWREFCTSSHYFI